MRYLAVLLFGLMAFNQTAMSAENSPLKFESQFDVNQTLDRIEKIIKSKGLTVFARIDHQKGAKAVGLEMPAAQLLVFGNPKAGTPLMNDNIEVGFDLPLKAYAFQDKGGKTFLMITNPLQLKDEYNLEAAAKVIDNIQKAVNGLGKAATTKTE